MTNPNHTGAPALARMSAPLFTSEIRFYRACGRFGFLSNLYRLEVPIRLPDELDEDGRLFRKAAYFETSEAAYQYGKPLRQEVADWIVSPPYSRFCAVAGHLLPWYDVRPKWNDIKVDRMRTVLRLKFDRKERYSLWQALLDTGQAVLIEKSKMDAFWGIGKKGAGENMLGKLLMELRDQLSAEAAIGRNVK